jgi:hypothetical protein
MYELVQSQHSSPDANPGIFCPHLWTFIQTVGFLLARIGVARETWMLLTAQALVFRIGVNEQIGNLAVCFL